MTLVATTPGPGQKSGHRVSLVSLPRFCPHSQSQTNSTSLTFSNPSSPLTPTATDAGPGRPGPQRGSSAPYALVLPRFSALPRWRGLRDTGSSRSPTQDLPCWRRGQRGLNAASSAAETLPTLSVSCKT